MGIPIFSFRSFLDCGFVWLDQRFQHSKESWTTPLARIQISISISILFPLAAFLWFSGYDHENARIAFVYCSTLIPIVISLLCLFFLQSIQESDASREESIILSQLLFILSTVIGTMTALAWPPNKFGMYLNCSFMLWGFFLETPLGLTTKMGFVNGGASMTIGFVRGLDWWGVIAVPICLAVGLNLFSWRFKKVIFPDDPTRLWVSKILDDTKNLVLLLEREHRQLNRIIREASRKADEFRAALSSNLEAYEISKNAMVAAKNHLAIMLDSTTLEDEQIPVFLLEKQQQLNRIIMDASRKAEEYQAALYSALDAYETTKNAMDDAKKHLGSQLDSKAREVAEYPALMLEMEQNLNQLVIQVIGKANEYWIARSSALDAYKASKKSMEDAINPLALFSSAMDDYNTITQIGEDVKKRLAKLEDVKNSLGGSP